MNMARGSEEGGFVVDVSSIRAALIVLLHHSMVKAVHTQKGHGQSQGHQGQGRASEKNLRFDYVTDINRALLLPRYPRYVEYAKKNYREEGAAIVEELLVHGRMMTEEIILESTECLTRYLAVGTSGSGSGSGSDNGNDDGDDDEEHEVSSEQKMALAQKVIEALSKMVEHGFVEMVEPVVPIDEKVNQQDDTNESSDQPSVGRKRRLDEMTNTCTDDGGNVSAHVINIRSILSRNNYKRTFPPGAVWRVNIQMFHAYLRSFYIGRLVAERYGHEKSYGAIITAALKYIAHKKYSPTFQKQNGTEGNHFMIESSFTPDDIMQFLPAPILAEFKNKAGGARSNLSSALVTLAQFVYPKVLAEVEDAQGHAQGGKFEVTTRQAMTYLKGRIIHEVVRERYGVVAARICAILQAKGHLESDAIAESAMVPAKDAREILHQLYKSNYLSLFYLQQTKQHNPSTAIYLWYVDNSKIENIVLNNTCKALYNLRLRRQHEVQVGKDWIERAKEAGETDENDSELDKLNKNKFCQGLERLDNACLQLDETLMLLKDFSGQ